MNVGELIELLSDMPEDTDVFMPFTDNSLITACYAKSGPILLDIEEEKRRIVFLVMPCQCDTDGEVEIDIDQNLN